MSWRRYTATDYTATDANLLYWRNEIIEVVETLKADASATTR